MEKVHLNRLSGTAQGNSGNVDESHQNESLLNLSHLSEISSGNTSFIVDMLSMFLLEIDGFIVEMKKQVEIKDLYSLKRSAHSMKPSGEYIGVHELTSMFASLERSAAHGDYQSVVMLADATEKLVIRLREQINTYIESAKTEE